MSRDIDLSKPLSDEEVAELKTRYTLEQVSRFVALAQGSDFNGEEEKPKRRSRSSAKKEEDAPSEDAPEDETSADGEAEDPAEPDAEAPSEG